VPKEPCLSVHPSRRRRRTCCRRRGARGAAPATDCAPRSGMRSRSTRGAHSSTSRKCHAATLSTSWSRWRSKRLVPSARRDAPAGQRRALRRIAHRPRHRSRRERRPAPDRGKCATRSSATSSPAGCAASGRTAGRPHRAAASWPWILRRRLAHACSEAHTKGRRKCPAPFLV
jgi:hypothetical protein